MTRFLVVLAFLGLNFYTYHYLASTEVRPPRESFESFPEQLGSWQCPGFESMAPGVEKNLGVTDYLICNFRGGEVPTLVGVYVGYHESQVRKEGGGSRENAIHPPKHCLPGSGWDIIASELVDLDVAGLPERPALVNRLIIAKGQDRQLVYYWYQSRGRVIARDWQKIVELFWDRALRSRTDGSLVRFTIPIDRRGLLPHLARYVPE